MSMFERLAAERLAEIDARYPAAHKQQVTARLRRAWEKQPAADRIPYVVLHYRQDGFAPQDDLSAWENEFLAQLQGILNHREWDDDYLPVFHFGILQALIPAYFGCGERHSQDGRSVETVPVIREAADVYTLAPVGFGPETLGGQMLEKMRFFQQAAQGHILLAETDMQGPFSVASQIWGVEEFLLAVYEEPEAVHHLLELTTDAIITYIQKMFAVSEGNLSPCHCMPYLWMDSRYGVCVSEDLLAVVSPAGTEEFIAPYLERIGRAFGGVLVHTCGSMNHSIRVLTRTPYLTGVNCSSSETDIPRLVADGGEKLTYLVHSAPVSCMNLPLLSCEEQLVLCRETFGRRYAGISQVVLYTKSPQLDIPRTAAALQKLAVL